MVQGEKTAPDSKSSCNRRRWVRLVVIIEEERRGVKRE